MNPINIGLLVGTFIIAGYLFVVLYKSNMNIGENQQHALTLDAGQMVSFIIGIQLYLTFPFNYSVVGIINILIGAVVGVVFSLKNSSKLLSCGFFFGGLAAIMGTMVGTLAINPEVCGLPLTKLPIQNPDMAIGIISMMLLFVTLLFVINLLKPH